MPHQPLERRRKRQVLLFDVDGTLTGDDGISSYLLPRLCRARSQGYSLGLCSSQSPGEVTRFLTEELRIQIGPRCLFNAGLILEDGHVWVPPGRIPLNDARILTSQVALAEMQCFRIAVSDLWRPASAESLQKAGWGFLDGVPDSPVQLAPKRYQAVGSVSIWEKGPEVTSPAYHGEYDVVMTWAQAKLRELGLQNVELMEAGNGTLRLLEMGLNKGSSLVRLGFDLSRVVYFGNGFNDVPAAKVVRAAGGLVLVVANTVTELKELAHQVANQSAGAGVVELLDLLFGSQEA